MERFQLDTRSRHHQILLEWAAARHPPRDGGEEAMIARWRAWDGVAASDPQTFTEALAVEDALSQTLLDAVRRQLLPPALKHAPYEWSRDDVWLLETLGVADAGSETSVDWDLARTKAGFDRFGLDEAEVATAAVRAASQVQDLYPERNRWAAQHPVVGRVPLLGPLFAIATPQQLGWPDLVRVERPTGGASARLVWNLRDPARSTWITPVGQSGHVRSPHYADLQPIFQAGERVPVFDAEHDWGS
jgi:penicillin amidase